MRISDWSSDVCSSDLFDAQPVASPEFAAVFAGNALMPGMAPFAANYGGNQFGHWAGQLGDSRAITLGEAIAADGSRHKLQIKGARPTPYSRPAHTRPERPSSIRQFLCTIGKAKGRERVS